MYLWSWVGYRPCMILCPVIVTLELRPLAGLEALAGSCGACSGASTTLVAAPRTTRGGRTTLALVRQVAQRRRRLHANSVVVVLGVASVDIEGRLQYEGMGL